MSSFGESLSDQEINDMIATADTDGDGKVSYDGKYQKHCPVFTQKTPTEKLTKKRTSNFG